MKNVIEFEDMRPLVFFEQLLPSNCFIYPEPVVSDQVYMKISEGYCGAASVSLKSGKTYQVDPKRLVQPVCVKIRVTRAVGDCR